MTEASIPGPARASSPLQRRRGATTVGLGVASAAAVPFAVTGLFRLGMSALLVLFVCLATAGALVAVPRRGPWLAVGWLVGCALWAVAIGVVLWQLGQGFEGFEG